MRPMTEGVTRFPGSDWRNHCPYDISCLGTSAITFMEERQEKCHVTFQLLSRRQKKSSMVY